MFATMDLLLHYTYIRRAIYEMNVIKAADEEGFQADLFKHGHAQWYITWLISFNHVVHLGYHDWVPPSQFINQGLMWIRTISKA